MAGKDIIIMSQKELKRLHIIKKVLAEELKQVEVVDILGLGIRQVGRTVQRVREEGDKGIIHKSRGRQSNRAIPQKVRDKIIELYKDKYKGFGPTFAVEKLLELDKIKISDETLRQWLIKEGLWERSRKNRKHRRWRERKCYFGQMSQVDGSHHDWFEGRGPKCVLMLYIDDATNTVFARFYEYEGTIPAMDSFKRYIKKYGLPQSIYVDKHSTYKSCAKPSIEDELNNRKPLSQFERALEELGVKVIHAHSPQAKGRVERSFKTFQDRLVKEMRLKKISSIEEANEFLKYYLPIFNQRFSVEAAKKADLHRPLPKNINLNTILCIKTKRALRNDFTIAHHKILYQIEEHVNTRKVIVEERIDGRMFITHKGRNLKYKDIKQRPVKEIKFKTKKPWIPPMDHPWKKPMYNKRIAIINNINFQKEKTNQKGKELLLTKT